VCNVWNPSVGNKDALLILRGKPAKIYDNLFLKPDDYEQVCHVSAFAPNYLTHPNDISIVEDSCKPGSPGEHGKLFSFLGNWPNTLHSFKIQNLQSK